MKLKTLKDMEFRDIFDNSKTPQVKQEIIKFELKAEAIKWVKAEDWEDFWKWLLNKKGVRFGESVGVELACYVLEYIFNLTEEDLK